MTKINILMMYTSIYDRACGPHLQPDIWIWQL